jgi:hypothetical protein
VNIPPRNSVVEWHEEFSSVRTGIVANLPLVKRIGRVICESTSNPGFMVLSDHEGSRRVVAANKLRVIALDAEAGWASLLDEGDRCDSCGASFEVGPKCEHYGTLLAGLS